VCAGVTVWGSGSCGYWFWRAWGPSIPRGRVRRPLTAGSSLDERRPYRERVQRASCSTGVGRESSGFGGPGTLISLSLEEDLTFGRAEGRGGGHPTRRGTPDGQMTSRTASATGSCPVCGEGDICLITSTGALRKHGHKHGRPACTGSYGLPVDNGVEGAGRGIPAAPGRRQLQDTAGGGATVGGSKEIETETAGETEDLIGARPPEGILKWIPKGARGEAAALLQKLLTRVNTHPSDLTGWRDLLGFPNGCLAKPKRGGKARNLTKIVLKAISTYGSARRETPTPTQLKTRPPKLGDTERRTAERASEKLGEGDVRGAIRTLCSTATIAPPNAQNYAKLTTLHPTRPADRQQAECPREGNPLIATPTSVKAAIGSFASGSAAGLDGLRPQHLKDILMHYEGGTWGGATRGEEGPPEHPLLNNITAFINLLLSGNGIPPEVGKTLYGGSLMALNKPGGGLRPIAIGLVWRRLTAKVCVQHVTKRATALLAPRQLGFGVRGGSEAAAHAARRFVQSMKTNHILVKLDFKNAFNTLHRDVILEEIKEHFPEIYPFSWATYSTDSILSFGDYTISSEEGAQQGDPLGPLYFCMAINKLLQSASSDFVCAYLDDLTLGGEAVGVIADVKNIEKSAASIGLELNHAKSEVIGASPATKDLLSAASLSFKDTDKTQASLLGAPLYAEGVDSALQAKNDDLTQLVSRLKFLPMHDTLFLLKNTLAIPKLLYTLRTSPCSSSPELKAYDNLLRNTLSSLLNINLSDSRWAQASLPVAEGGLGVRSAVMLAPSAFLASVTATREIVNSLLPARLRTVTDMWESPALERWREMAGRGVEGPMGEEAGRQRIWDAACVVNTAEGLLRAATTDADRARLRAVRAKGSGDWLQALPLANIGLRMDDVTVTIAVSLRLGADIVQDHVCACSAPVQPNGHHGLSCVRSAGRQQRHASVNDIVHRALHSAGLQAMLEPLGLVAESSLRPDGVTLLPWSRGKPLVWDFTCPDTLAPSHVNQTSAKAGAAAEIAEVNKLRKYSALDSRYEVIPIAVETLGPIGQRGYEFLESLGRKIAERTQEPRASSFLRQRISVAIQRGNSASVQGTHKHLAPN